MASQLKDVFDRCYKVGQSQCALLLGNRTRSIAQMIKEVAEPFSAAIFTLSGLLCTDDLQGLQNLAFQVSKHTGTEYTDMNFQLTLSYIKRNLNPSYKIVISISDIQEFAHKNLKQVLLYTLFELVHEEICMVCVIGVTNRLDFIELLEKRIKSRFSYQTIITLNTDLLENLMQGIELEDYNTKALQQLGPLHLSVLICYMKLSIKKIQLNITTAFKEFETFKLKSPMILYQIDKFTFTILTNYLVKCSFLKVLKKHVVERFTEYKLSFDPVGIIYSIKKDSIEVPTAIQEWVHETC
jgi:hypothetical protein